MLRPKVAKVRKMPRPQVAFRKGDENNMFWEFIILLAGIFAALYAFPYGKWELTENNKTGGITVYITAGICIILSGIQIFI